MFCVAQDIIRTHVLTKFHIDKNAPPTGDHNKSLTKFHADRTITFAGPNVRKTTPPPSGHVFQPTGIIFELVKYIIGTNHRTTNVATRMQTRQMLTPHNAQRTKDDPDDDEVPVTRPRNTHMSHDWEPGTNQQGAGWERAF
ncbi:hypothetical protein DPMN_079441 [Dreissena polymorpha]|uniref:Uncharacterized protein n=1 Tax=Dreissena polymorpha TaxID=45954 RepID=A0A9D4BR83_DREPO|nr:hypothetical protein DPMN_079441 [Dreissena polymorpha]